MKLLFTVGVLAVVWLVFFKSRRPTVGGNFARWGGALGKAARAMSDSAQARKGVAEAVTAPDTGPTAAEPTGGNPKTVDLRPCPRCGTYVAAGTTCVCTPP